MEQDYFSKYKMAKKLRLVIGRWRSGTLHRYNEAMSLKITSTSLVVGLETAQNQTSLVSNEAACKPRKRNVGCRAEKNCSKSLGKISLTYIKSLYREYPAKRHQSKHHIFASRNDNPILKKVPGRIFKPILCFLD